MNGRCTIYLSPRCDTAVHNVSPFVTLFKGGIWIKRHAFEQQFTFQNKHRAFYCTVCFCTLNFITRKEIYIKLLTNY